MSEKLRLHYAPDNASLVVRLALEESNQPYESILVNRQNEGQKSASYLKMNPNGLIPVLETNQGALFETAAILLWIVDTFGGLGPSTSDPARGRFLKWLFFVSNTLHPAMRMTFYPDCYIGEDPAMQSKLREVSINERIRFVDMLEREASDPEGVLGDANLNVLDLYLAASMRWMQIYPSKAAGAPFKTTNWPGIHAMIERLEQRASVAALCEAEGMRPSPFTSPEYPDPPEGSATA